MINALWHKPQVSGKLKRLAYEYQLAVVITNQVTDHFPHEPDAALKKARLHSPAGRPAPAPHTLDSQMC